MLLGNVTSDQWSIHFFNTGTLQSAVSNWTVLSHSTFSLEWHEHRFFDECSLCTWWPSHCTHSQSQTYEASTQTACQPDCSDCCLRNEYQKTSPTIYESKSTLYEGQETSLRGAWPGQFQVNRVCAQQGSDNARYTFRRCCKHSVYKDCGTMKKLKKYRSLTV